MSLLAFEGLDPGNLLGDALVDALLEGGAVSELEENLQVHEERSEDKGWAGKPSTHGHRASQRTALTTEQVVEEGRRTALGKEMSGELGAPRGSVNVQRSLDGVCLVREGCGGEGDGDLLREVDELSAAALSQQTQTMKYTRSERTAAKGSSAK